MDNINMNFTAPVKLAFGVEIVSIMPTIARIGMIVHLSPYSPEQLQTPEMQQEIREKLQCGYKYLVDEGFVIPAPSWKIDWGTVLHIPNETN